MIPNVRFSDVRVVFKPEVLGQVLANDPTVARHLVGLAEEIITEAENVLDRLGSVTVPPWSYDADPEAITEQMSVKDGSREFPLRASFVKAAQKTRVALAISNHPFSMGYEFGLHNLPATAFFRHAIGVVAARHPSVKRRYAGTRTTRP